MFNNFRLIWAAIITLFAINIVGGLLLAGMYDSLRMKIKYMK